MGKKNKTTVENKVQPWTDVAGNLLSDAELKIKSRVWSLDVWRSYLDSLDGSLRESQISPKQFDQIASNENETIFSWSQTSSRANDFGDLHNSISRLTIQQRNVIELLYYKSNSHREAARALSISESRVRDLKQQGLKNMKLDLQRGALTFPLVTEQKKRECKC